MTTHERELLEPVDLCEPDGERLNPSALGWSRRPLHRANLHGQQGRNKRWDYWAILAGDVLVSSVYADVDHAGLGEVWWAHLPSGRTGGGQAVVPADAVSLPERCGTAPLVLSHPNLDLSITDDGTGTHLVARWREPDGREAGLDVLVAARPGHESLNVVIPWDDVTFNFTSKHQARPATGHLAVGDDRWEIGGDTDAWGVLDVGRGRWPHEIRWNWGGGAGRSGEHVIGLQFGARWTDGSGFTENGFLLDGVLTKIGRELDWTYDWDDPMAPWRIVDPEGQIDVTLHPRHDKHSRSGDEASAFASETHQVFGTFSGTIRTDDGETHSFDGLQGFTEEARQRW